MTSRRAACLEWVILGLIVALACAALLVAFVLGAVK